MRLVCDVKVIPIGRHLATLEVGDLDRPLAFAGMGRRCNHQLECGPFAERMGKRLEVSALLKEQPLQQVRGSDSPVVVDWHPEMPTHA